jgi:hypothetical protein
VNVSPFIGHCEGVPGQHAPMRRLGTIQRRDATNTTITKVAKREQ